MPTHETDLFPIEESLSPRLEWLRKWNIHTSICNAADGGKEWCAWFYPSDTKPWDYMASMCSWLEEMDLSVLAKTEDECLTALWNKWEGFEEELTEYNFNKPKQ